MASVPLTSGARPETRPPAPRLARSSPSSSTVNDSGPRLETITTGRGDMGPFYTGPMVPAAGPAPRCFTVSVRVVIAPDKFKGTITARAVARAIADRLWEMGHDTVE